MDMALSNPWTFARHPYATSLLIVLVAGLIVFVIDQLTGFPPLIILGGAPAICFVMLGVRPGLVALLLAALISDFFFVEPVLTFTRHSFVLTAYYSVAALVSFKLIKRQWS
jgi:K+-sensing histidine kinase KdpD